MENNLQEFLATILETLGLATGTLDSFGFDNDAALSLFGSGINPIYFNNDLPVVEPVVGIDYTSPEVGTDTSVPHIGELFFGDNGTAIDLTGALFGDAGFSFYF